MRKSFDLKDCFSCRNSYSIFLLKKMGRMSAICLVLVGLFVGLGWSSPSPQCRIKALNENARYDFDLTLALKDYPHGLLSEDGYYSIIQNDTESDTEIKIWFQPCEHMVFNHDPPTCLRCSTCGGSQHCGLECSALMERNIDEMKSLAKIKHWLSRNSEESVGKVLNRFHMENGYHICTTLGYATSSNISLIDTQNPQKGVQLSMSAYTTDGECSLLVSVHCDKKFQEVSTIKKLKGCHYVATMAHPSGCPIVTSFRNKGWGWAGTLFTIVLCILLAYLTIGIVYRLFVLGIRGREVIPNLEFWSRVPRRIQMAFESMVYRTITTYYRVRHGPYT